MKKTILLLLSISVILISVTECNLLTGRHGFSGSSTQTSVSFQSVTGSGTPAPSPITYTDPTTADSITINSAKLLIRQLTFHGMEDEMGEDSSGHQRHREDSVRVKFHEKHNIYKTGPYVLDISLDTTVSTVGVANLPHGTYNMITFQVHKLTPGEQVSDNSFSPTDSSGMTHYYSIIVKGTYNGSPFVFTSSKTFFVKTMLNPPLTVQDSVANYNATIQVNVSGWFVGNAGGIIDPTDPANAHRIEMAIRRTFHAFNDNNKDGRDDHMEHGEGGGGNGYGNGNGHGNGHGHGNH